MNQMKLRLFWRKKNISTSFFWLKIVVVCAACNNKDTRGSKRGHCEAFKCVRAKEKMSVKVSKEEKNGNSRRESFGGRKVNAFQLYQDLPWLT